MPVAFFPISPSLSTSMNIDVLSWWLIVIGAINWGLVGLGSFVGNDWNVIHMLLGSWAPLEWIVYMLIGLSGLFVFSKKR